MTTLMVVLEAAAGLVAMSKGFAAIGAAIAVVGAALGIGKIGQQAMDAIARQPEATGDIRSSMIVAAALIEGLAFFAIIVALLVLFV